LRVIVIGGAGFIGSHLVDALVGGRHQVRVVDSLDPQVHPTEGLDNLPDASPAGAGIFEKAHAELRDRGLIR
jgi:nucleoside-diphosphate-sugar epimerase